MPRGEPTMVYPGGQTRCLFSSAPDFAFQVHPGDPGKLLLVFGAGGACWSKVTATIIHSCYKTKVAPSPLRGVLSRDSHENPFSNYTVVQIKYCTGDLHAGNVSQPFHDKQGVPVEQRGYLNTRSAIDWVKANLGQRFSSFVLLGHSAGAVGVQLLASELLGEFQFGKATVIADSWAGIFPPGFEGPVFKGLGMCPVGFLRGALRADCEAGNSTIADVYEAAMREFPQVTFANVNSKYDFGQIMYYKLAAITMGRIRGTGLGGAGYLRQLSEIIARFSKHPNYVSFLKTGRQHIFLDGYAKGRFQSTSALPEKDGIEVTLQTWLRDLLEGGTAGAGARSICDRRGPRDPCGVAQSMSLAREEEEPQAVDM